MFSSPFPVSARFSALVVPLLVALLSGASGCDVGGTSSGVGGAGGAGGTGGGGETSTCAPVDCSIYDNSMDPRCQHDPAPGALGSGESFFGSSPGLMRGFVEGPSLYVAFTANSSEGALFRVDLATGDRTWLSGRWEDPQQGTQTRGAGPSLGAPYDVVRAPDGGLFVMVANELGRQLLHVDEASGDRTLAKDIASMANLCKLIDMANVSLEYELEVGPNGAPLVVGDAAGGAGLFELDVENDTCSTISFATDDGNRVGEGPEFSEFKTLTIQGGKAYTSNPGSYSLVEIDLATGQRRRFSSSSSATPVGEGPPAGAESILAGSGVVYAGRPSTSTSLIVTEVDLATGDRTELFQESGPLGNSSSVLHVYGEVDGCFYLGDRGTLFTYDPKLKRSNALSR